MKHETLSIGRYAIPKGALQAAQLNYSNAGRENQNRRCYLPGLLSRSDCQQLIDRTRCIADEPGRTSLGLDSKQRVSRLRWLFPTAENQSLYEQIAIGVCFANAERFQFDIDSVYNLQITEYAADEGGHFAWHFDMGAAPIHDRKLSVVILLSDPSEFDGGALEFPESREPPLAQGDALIFPSYMMHRVTPLTRGRRHSLVTWITGPRFR